MTNIMRNLLWIAHCTTEAIACEHMLSLPTVQPHQRGTLRDQLAANLDSIQTEVETIARVRPWRTGARPDTGETSDDTGGS